MQFFVVVYSYNKNAECVIGHRLKRFYMQWANTSWLNIRVLMYALYTVHYRLINKKYFIVSGI